MHGATFRPLATFGAEALAANCATMIALFTDFGYEGPYVGQMKAVLHRMAHGVPIVDLMHDAPAFEPLAAGYLLAAIVTDFPEGSVVVAVVDPGVGTERAALTALAGGRWFVGPDNGLLDPICRLSDDVQRWEIRWRPARMSASFHGRDLFSPVAARLARGELPEHIGASPIDRAAPRVAADWPRVIYIDRFGNVISGMRASQVPQSTVIEVGRHRLSHARTFGDVPAGSCFWHANSHGLVELAANRASAAERLGLGIGDEISLSSEDHR